MRDGDVVADRFQILRQAGSGGMGVVYRARDRQHGHDVALKLLTAAEGDYGHRFVQESELLSSLKHPHIVGYVAHGTTDGGALYLVMPWLEGVDLQTRLRSGPLSVEETLVLARCIADGLGHLHGHGLVHRDLKPSNLFLPSGRLEDVQLIDLGIARPSTPSRLLTVSGVVMGTPGYIAPEQALERGTLSPSADIFALGCVLFECLTGRRLFDGTHVMAVLAKVLVEEAPHVSELRPGIPEALDRLLHRMVSKDPARRPAHGAELARLLGEIRASADEVASRTPSALTASERRVVSVLVVVLPPPDTLAEPVSSRADAGQLSALAYRFGVRMQTLDARTAVVLAPAGLGADDQAAVLARFGGSVAETFAGASVALATGSALTGDRLPVGEAIDRGVSIVRSATPGRGVLIDDLTAALVTSRFDVRREVDRLVLSGERVSLDPSRTLLGRPTSCLGRDRELTMLEATYAECVEGPSSKVVLITAPPGTGKSRLRHELVRRLAVTAHPPNVLQCRGDPLHVATPYAQVAQVVLHALGGTDLDPPSDAQGKLRRLAAAQVAPEDVERVASFLGELVGRPFSDVDNVQLRAARRSPEAMADQITLACTDLVRGLCRCKPTMLVLEDAHWCDAATIRLVDDVLRRLAHHPFFVLALARPELRERFPDPWSRRHPTEIRLPPLPARASAKLVHDVMGEDVGDDDVTRIVTRSEGNAFYLEELIREATERRRRSSRPPARPPQEVPETVVAMAQARLERLEPTARRVLRAASVFGEVFPRDGVSALVGESPQALEATMSELTQNETLAPAELPLRGDAMQELVFRHAFLRAAAYATLTDEDRTLGHRLAAGWLEERGEDAEVIAVHWLEGGDRTRAAAAFGRAAAVWRARVHPDAAARCAVRALLVFDRIDDPRATLERIGVLADSLEAVRRVDVGDVLAGIERHAAVGELGPGASGPAIVHAALRRALDALRAAGGAAAAGTARAATALASLGDFAGARTLLAEARAQAGEQLAALRSISHAAAKVAYLAGESGAAVAILGATVLPDDARESIDMLLILATETVAVEGRAALARGLECVARAEGRLESLGDDPILRVRCGKARTICFYLAGSYAEAAEAAEAVASLARHGALRYEECAHLHNAGELYLRMGDEARARAALGRSLEMARDLGADHLRIFDEALLAYLEGKTERLREVGEEFRASADAWRELHVRYWLGRLLTAQDPGEARRELGRALDIARSLEVRIFVDLCENALSATSRDA